MAKNYKTIALTGAEQKVVLAGQNCDIRNDSVDVVYASAEAGITSGADGVLSIPAGQAAKLLDCRGTLYILGTGSVMLCGNDYSELVFKSAASATGGGGGTVDDVARQAISSHANNADIHLTAEEREAWNDALKASAVVTGVGLGFAANQTVTVEEFIEALAAKFGNEKIVLSRVAWATFDSITITDGATSISFNGGFITGMVCSTDKAWHNTRLMYCQGDGGDNNDVYLIRGYATDDVVESNYTITKINDGGNADTVNGFTLMTEAQLSTPIEDCASYTDLFSQMPENSMFIGYTWTPASWFPEQIDSNWHVIIYKYTNASIDIRVFSTSTTTINYRASYAYGTTWSGWTRINDNGNADTLGGYHASDFVLKSEYDALAARVAALESGT